MPLEKYQFDYKDNDRQQEHKNRDPVDPMHVFHPLGMRRIGIPFLNVEVLCKLSPYSHNSKLLLDPKDK
jgi:hypothetical protein